MNDFESIVKKGNYKAILDQWGISEPAKYPNLIKFIVKMMI